MARQTGQYVITGVYDNLCFYRMEGRYYVRRKSSLSGKRVQADAAFTKTMQYARLLGDASKIASMIYRELSATKKVKGLFRVITGTAMQRLKQGDRKEDVLQALWLVYCVQQRKQAQKVPPKIVCDGLFTAWLKAYLFTECLQTEEQDIYEYALVCDPP